MYKRNLSEKIEKALLRSPVVLLTGARQTGKTTLMKELGERKNYHYLSFDATTTRTAAQNDPEGFIASLTKPILLDEVQRVPEIFLPIKIDVDTHKTPGMYALTGSANPLLIPRVGDSLAGRMLIYTLYPLSQGEIRNRRDDFIDKIFEPESISYRSSGINREELSKMITIGGYPGAQNLDEAERSEFFDSYLTSILERDVRDISNIVAFPELQTILKTLATRVGNLHNIADVSRGTKLPYTTLRRYIALLQSVYLIDFLPPWSTNFGSRLVHSPKAYVVDSGLLAFLLHVNEELVFSHPSLLGPLLENFVVTELIKQRTWSKRPVHLSHFRTAIGEEVDIVIEDASGNLIGIEVKASHTVTSSDFRGMNSLKDKAKKKFRKGIVLYTGQDTIPFARDLFAVPIDALWLL